MADRSSYPSEQADKFLLRLPDGMRDKIAETAKANNRSMNAEIVARLERSFSDHEAGRVFTTIHVVLDTGGLPTSWDEIHEHLRAFSKAGQLKVAAMQVHVVTPELMSSDLREEHANSLAKFYRDELRRSTKEDIR